MSEDRLSQVRNPGEPELSKSEIETENIFDPELLNRPDPAFLEEMGGFLDNPMGPLIKVLAQSLEACAPKPLVLPDPPKTEHKVKIFWLHRSLKIEEVEEIETVIEAFLNDGYRGFPTVCNDFLIMDFSRRKETEEDATIQR